MYMCLYVSTTGGVGGREKESERGLGEGGERKRVREVWGGGGRGGEEKCL